MQILWLFFSQKVPKIQLPIAQNVQFFQHKNPLHFLLAQGMKRFLTNKFFIPLERDFLPFASCTNAFLR